MAAEANSASASSGADNPPQGRAPDARQRVGMFLRETREARGLTLGDVSTVLRIRESHIGAIEDGRFRDLPGSAYATGFVRSYARYLDLDETLVVERFKDEVAAVEAEAELVLPYATRERRFPSAAVLVATVLVAVVAYGAWHIFASADPAGAPDIAVGTEAPVAGGGVAPSDQGEAVTPVDRIEPSPATAPAAPADDKATFGPATGESDSASAADTDPSLAVPASAVRDADAERPQVLVRALSDSWIQVLDPVGNPMFSHILRKGEEFAVPNHPGVRLTVGNTGTVRLIVNGRVLPALGPDGTIRRNIALDPDKLAALH